MRATLLFVLALLPAQTAWAQGAAKGADHYEVTIAPPARPGSAPVQPAPGPASAAPNEAAPVAPGTDSPVAPAAPAAPAASDPAAVSAARPETAAPAGPLHTLQVGAYRHRSSAEEMSDRLGTTYGEVQVVEVDSGGEKLYRVRVGRLPAGPALGELKRRLLAAGYPAFEVELPR